MNSNIVLHEYDVDSRVTAFSTTRHGGCSFGNYASFNINQYCGDDETCINANRKELCRLLHIEDNRLFLPHQVHGTDVVDISPTILEQSSPITLQNLIQGKDAITTNAKNCCIGVSTADCIPILLYDKQNHVAAAVHAGWRGTVASIAKHTISHMMAVYGSCPENIIAAIGPGISLDCFEVGDEVYEAFLHEGFPMEQIARRYPPMNQNAGVGARWHIDLPLCNCLQLISAGVPQYQVHMSGICTYEQCTDFFSARRLGIMSGRIFTGIVLS